MINTPIPHSVTHRPRPDGHPGDPGRTPNSRPYRPGSAYLAGLFVWALLIGLVLAAIFLPG
jgi:hypothetical protein